MEQSGNCEIFPSSTWKISGGPKSKGTPRWKTVRLLAFRILLLIIFLTTYLYVLHGRERGHPVPIASDSAWNDVIIQVDPLQVDSSAAESPRETLGNARAVVHKFLMEHRSERSVRLYEATDFRAIEQARARLQKSDKDLEIIRDEWSYKDNQAKSER
jgi:hypothetical protein